MGIVGSEVYVLVLLLSVWAQADVPDLAPIIERVEPLRAKRRGANPPPIPPETYAKVQSGQTVTSLDKVEGVELKVAWGVTAVPHPIQRVWSAINDFSDRTDYSKVEFSEVQQGEHCGSGRQVFQYLPIGFPVSDRWWVSTLRINDDLAQASEGSVRELYFRASTEPEMLKTEAARQKAESGVPVGFSEGAWLLIAAGDAHTIVEYHASSDPGGTVPTSFANAFATGGVKSTLEAVIKLAGADPRCP
ncbi:MAG: hypothetical protein EA397_13230 [Deltaproteobacteria bacterium]|nr:MAG: hypothetical protein EA397_13230 [Deltaproteobacteria bacterium]